MVLYTFVLHAEICTGSSSQVVQISLLFTQHPVEQMLATLFVQLIKIRVLIILSRGQLNRRRSALTVDRQNFKSAPTHFVNN